MPEIEIKESVVKGSTHSKWPCKVSVVNTETLICAKCKNSGHNYKDCKLRYPVCFKCGWVRVISRDCPRCNGLLNNKGQKSLEFGREKLNKFSPRKNLPEIEGKKVTLPPNLNEPRAIMPAPSGRNFSKN